MTTLLKKAVAKAQALSDPEQDRLASLLLQEIEAARQYLDADVSRRSIWEDIADMTAEEEEVWEPLPGDGAAEHDHYLYGTKKRFT